ncbi:MAG: PfkB family carbohydrate kinase [Pseudomonadota bacterium]
MARVICVGHSALDRIFTVDAWPSASAKVTAKTFVEAGGGMAGNAAVAIARLGGEALFWGPVGEDGVADVMEVHFRRVGVDIGGMRRFPGLYSSTSAILVDARGERLIVSYRGTALEAPADWLPLSQLNSCAALLADVRWPQGALPALRAARDAEIPTIVDGDTADRATLRSLAGAAEYAVFSAAGLICFAGAGDTEDRLRQALALGARFAAATDGERGVSWIEAGQPGGLQHLPAFAVPVVDTLAAGDVFHGAFALMLAEGRTPAAALRFASAAAAINCGRAGGRDGSPCRDEVERFLREAGVRP